MKKILVPIDFSEQALNALDVAIQLAKRMDAEITILHIVEAPIPSGVFVGSEFIPPGDNLYYLKTLVEDARLELQSVLEKNESKGVTLHQELAIGNPYVHISSYIVDKQVDLVVIGSKGSSGVEELLIGSNTEKVIRKAKCPVLTVKEKVSHVDVRRIVFASDFEEDELTIIHYVKDFQRWFKASLYLVKINTPNHFETTSSSHQKMETFARKYQLENYTFHIYNELAAEDGIVYFAEEVQADLIAMATHGRTGIAHLFSGSVAESVANHAKRMILTINLNS